MALWGKTDVSGSKPKYLTTAEKATTFGVDMTEESVAANKAKGMAHSGWVKYTTYTDAQGRTRHKSEVLVAMGVTQAAMGDATDDATVPDA